ncbi:MAG: amidase family protein, partial [Leptothrix sp. (in: b-proteobacteria)]
PDWPHADADTRRAWDLAAQRLAPHAAAWVEPAWPADLPDLSALQLAVMTHEMARALRPDRLQHGPALSERLRTLLDAGMQISGAQHAAHLRQTLAARQRIDALFIGSGGPDGVDVLLSPSTPGEAPAGLDGTGDPLFCRGWTLLGLPCIHLPFSLGHSGLPVGLQLVGRHGDDHRLIAAAHWAHARLQRGDAT